MNTTNLEVLIYDYMQNATRQKLTLHAHEIIDPDLVYSNSLIVAQSIVKVLYTFQRTLGGSICLKEFGRRLHSEMDKKGVQANASI